MRAMSFQDAPGGDTMGATWNVPHEVMMERVSDPLEHFLVTIFAVDADVARRLANELHGGGGLYRAVSARRKP